MVSLDKKLLIVAGFMIVIFVAMLAGNPSKSENKESEKTMTFEKEKQKIEEPENIEKLQDKTSTIKEKDAIVDKISNALQKIDYSLGKEEIVKIDDKTNEYTYQIINPEGIPYGTFNVWVDDKIKKIEIGMFYGANQDSISVALLISYWLQNQLITNEEWKMNANTTYLEWITDIRGNGQERSITVNDKKVSLLIVIINESPLLAMMFTTIDYDKNTQIETPTEDKKINSQPLFRSSSDYCRALQEWMMEYQGSEWLTHDTQIEYDRVCS